MVNYKRKAIQVLFIIIEICAYIRVNCQPPPQGPPPSGVTNLPLIPPQPKPTPKPEKKCFVRGGNGFTVERSGRQIEGGTISLDILSVPRRMGAKGSARVECKIDIPKAKTTERYYYMINLGRKILEKEVSESKVEVEIDERDLMSNVHSNEYRGNEYTLSQPVSYISSTENVNMTIKMDTPILENIEDFSIPITWYAVPYIKYKLDKSLSRTFCPKGMDYYRNRCYKYVEKMRNKYTWNRAGRVCQRHSAKIVQIDDEAEMDFVWNQYIIPVWQRAGIRDSMAMFLDVAKDDKAKFSEWHIPPSLLQETPENIFVHQTPNNTGKYIDIKKHLRHNEKYLPPSLKTISPTEIMQPYPSDYQTCTVVYSKGSSYERVWTKTYCELSIPITGVVCELPVAVKEQYLEAPTNHICPTNWTMYQGRCLRMKSLDQARTPLMRFKPNAADTHLHVTLNPITILYEVTTELCSGSILKMNATERINLQHYITSVWRHRPMDMGVILKDEAGDCVNMQLKYTDNPVYLDEMEWNEVQHSCDGAKFEWATNVICHTPPVPNVISQCEINQFKCSSDKSCIAVPYVCDGIDHCPEGEDEMYCDKVSKVDWKCETGNATIPMAYYCDFKKDCPDGSDELYCSYTPCSKTQFKCQSGQCLDQSKRCNTVNDCWGDPTDENDCGNVNEDIDDYCENGTLCYTGSCIPLKTEYDIFPDCPGFVQEDEKGDLIPRTVKEAVSCLEPDNVRCRYDHPHCFPRIKACIDDSSTQAIPHCRHQEHLRDCQDFECPDMFKCPDSYCVPLRKVKDGVNDCPNGEDEHVANRSCPGLFRCHDGDQVTRCITQNEVCDGIDHCPGSNDDERNCDSLQHACPLGCLCQYRILQCNDNSNLDKKLSLMSTFKKWRGVIFHNMDITLDNNTFLGLNLLGRLDLSNNNINVLPKDVFSDLTSLYELDLSNNMITTIPGEIFIALQVLKKLHLDGNPLHTFESHAFYGLTFQHLSLQNLQLKSIPTEAFIGMSNVTEIDLRNNQIQTIEENAFQNPGRLSVLRLENNSIKDFPLSSFKSLQIEKLTTDSFSFCCLATDVDNCSPEPDEFSSCSNLLSNTVLNVVMWIMAWLALIGNIAVMVIHGRSKKKTKHIILIINLAISDLLMGIYLLMISSANQYYHGDYFLHESTWRSGPVCTLAGFFSVVSSQMSVFTLVLISLDRMIAILFPLKANSLSNKPWYIALASGWLVTLIIAAIPLAQISYFTGHFYGRNSVCLPLVITSGKSGAWEYNLVTIILVNLLSFIFIATAYVLIWRAVRRSQKIMKYTSTAQSNNIEVTLAIKAAFIVFTDFICWAPVIILSLLAISGWSVPRGVTAWMAVFVIPINSSINPFLYTISTLNRHRKKKPSSAVPKTKSTTVSYDSPQLLHKSYDSPQLLHKGHDSPQMTKKTQL